MNEQRRQILEMLAEGKITAAEADSLIAALEREQPTQVRPAAGGPRPKYLRVLTEWTEGATQGDCAMMGSLG